MTQQCATPGDGGPMADDAASADRAAPHDAPPQSQSQSPRASSSRRKRRRSHRPDRRGLYKFLAVLAGTLLIALAIFLAMHDDQVRQSAAGADDPSAGLATTSLLWSGVAAIGGVFCYLTALMGGRRSRGWDLE